MISVDESLHNYESNSDDNSKALTLSSKKRNRSPKPKTESKNRIATQASHSDIETDFSTTQTNLITTSNQNSSSYRILEPYRTLGLITSDTKFTYYKRANARFILVSNSNSFLLYNLDKLNLERISPPLPSKITAVAMINNIAYTASENVITAWNKIHIVSILF